MSKKKVTSNAHAQGTYFDRELFNEICGLMAEGQSLNKICARPDMPSRKSFFQWVAKDADLRAEYQFAIDMRADRYAEEIIDIADDSSEDEIFVETSDASGASAKRVCNNEFVSRSKLRVDARKWYASKLAPKKYGDKTIHAGDSENPLVVHHKRELTEEELLAIASKA